MYITINDVIGEKRIDLSYPISSGREIAVITMLSDNVQYLLKVYENKVEIRQGRGIEERGIYG